MPDTMMENQVQLAVIEIGFQLVSVFLNIIVLLFRDVLTQFLSGLFALVGGAGG